MLHPSNNQKRSVIIRNLENLNTKLNTLSCGYSLKQFNVMTSNEQKLEGRNLCNSVSADSLSFANNLG